MVSGRGTARLERLITRKLGRAVAQSARHLAEAYHENVTRRQVTPPGTYDGCEDGARSCPGEFPFTDTGQGADNVHFVADGLEARAGVRDDIGPYPRPGRNPEGQREKNRPPGGWHLLYLAGELEEGGDPDTKRLGLMDTFDAEISNIKEVFRNVAKSTK